MSNGQDEPKATPSGSEDLTNSDPQGDPENPSSGEGDKQEPSKGLGVQKTPEQIAQEEAQKELFGKPEQYDYKELMPEGMTAEPVLTEKFNSIASKFNLSQKGASEVMALAVELTQQTQKLTAETFAQAQEAKKVEYQKALNEDKEIGGAKLDETYKIANIAYEKFAPQEVQDLLFESGLNHHPQVVRMFLEIGKQMKTDTIHNSQRSPSEKRSAADILYGNKENKQ